jgi:hypothetical protein
MNKKFLVKCSYCGKSMETMDDPEGAKVFHLSCAEKMVRKHHSSDKLEKLAKNKLELLKRCPK